MVGAAGAARALARAPSAMRTRGVCQNEMRQCGSGPFAWMDDDLLQREFLPRLADLQSVAAFTMTSHRHHRLASRELG